MVDQSLLDQLTMGEHRQRAEGDEFVLDNASIPAASVQATDTSRFEGKVTFGDYTKDSDQLMSSWILTNLAGGALINEHTEGATDNRYRWGTLWALNSEQLALPPRVDVYQHGPDIQANDDSAIGPISMPLGETKDGIFFAFGKELWRLETGRYTMDGATWTKMMDLPGYAQDVGSRGSTELFLYIPMGEDGLLVYRTFNNTVANHFTDIHAVSVLVWDNKAFALTTDGELRVRSLQAPDFDPASPETTLPPDEAPRGLELFWDRAGDPAVFVVTDKALWAYDATNQILHRTTMATPKHHANGYGFTSWRDDALYISTGFGVDRYTRDGVRTPVGLDRDDGLPAELLRPEWESKTNWDAPSHAITAMAGTLNFLVATVQLGTDRHVQTQAGSDQSRYAVVAWNEAGWHPLYVGDMESDPAAGAMHYPNRLLVTENTGGYRIWWGVTAEKTVGSDTTSAYRGVPVVYSMELPRNFHAPRQRVARSISTFAERGSMETGWFDSGMRGFQKTFSHLEVELADPEDGQPLDGYVEIEYRVKGEPTVWNYLGKIETYGTTVLPFGLDETGFPRGITDTAIEFRLTLATSNPRRSPVVASLILKYIKLPLEGRAWIATIDLDSENMKGLGPREIDAMLSRKTYEGGFSKLVHHDMHKRIRIAQHQIVEGTGDNPFMRATVNMIEVPIHNWTPDDDG